MVPNTDTPDFVDPRTTPYVELCDRGELPHLYKDGCSYFVTFRLWDALSTSTDPASDHNTTPGRMVKRSVSDIAGAIEPPLRLGSCVLADAKPAEIVQGALRFFHGQRYHLAAWCVMPNHVHAVLTPFSPLTLSDILHSWKSYSSHRINVALGRTGTLWERESFDHLIRSVDDYEGFIQYVERNPVAAGLCVKPEQWPYSSAWFRPVL